MERRGGGKAGGESGDAPEGLRVQKYLAEHGVGSRREADALVAAGEVTINGEVAPLGARVRPGLDRVAVHGRPVKSAPVMRLSLALHKPRGWLCSNEDPHHTETVFELLPKAWSKHRLFCAGRLDRDSEGLLVLTNDGDLAERLTHPRHRVVKRYRVKVHRDFDTAVIPRLLQGVEDEGEFLKAEKVIPAKVGPDAAQRLEIHLNHGRKREIRRLLERFGYYTERLFRFQIGKFVLRGIGPGRFEVLREREIRLLTAETDE